MRVPYFLVFALVFSVSACATAPRPEKYLPGEFFTSSQVAEAGFLGNVFLDLGNYSPSKAQERRGHLNAGNSPFVAGLTESLRANHFLSDDPNAPYRLQLLGFTSFPPEKKNLGGTLEYAFVEVGVGQVWEESYVLSVTVQKIANVGTVGKVLSSHPILWPALALMAPTLLSMKTNKVLESRLRLHFIAVARDIMESERLKARKSMTAEFDSLFEARMKKFEACIEAGEEDCG